ncbi:hypothetical protein NE865_04940 [Phthorimaea operculella]|nr:hypothetical protein NE865_04940 [Phthorimaea operculella]
MKLFLLAFFVAAAFALPIPDDEADGNIEVIVNGVPEGAALDIAHIVDIQANEKVNGQVVAQSNVLEPFSPEAVAEAVAAAEAAAAAEAPEPAFVPRPVPVAETPILEPAFVPRPVPVAEQPAIPEPIALPAPAPVVVVPEPVALPEPAPAVVIPESVAMPEAAAPVVVAPVGSGDAGYDGVFPKPIALPEAAAPVVVDSVPEPVAPAPAAPAPAAPAPAAPAPAAPAPVAPAPAAPAPVAPAPVAVPDVPVAPVEAAEPVPEPESQIGEVINNGLVSLNVYSNGVISTLKGWLDVVVNYIGVGGVVQTTQVV